MTIFVVICLFYSYKQNGIDLTDPNCYTSISKEKFAEIFKSDSEYEIPMLEERYDVLREAGKKLLEVICVLWYF